ncbi:MAG TPA: hypothetical protein VD926_04590 [Acidimicrobiales bacterium]|nr:hypothetical protein [Acidimicrobiales bacterium]
MSVPDHFEGSYWRQDGPPVEAGALAVDNHDPTYGGQGVGLGPQVYRCLTCGAAVLDVETHAAWHDQ